MGQRRKELWARWREISLRDMGREDKRGFSSPAILEEIVEEELLKHAREIEAEVMALRAELSLVYEVIDELPAGALDGVESGKLLQAHRAMTESDRREAAALKFDEVQRVAKAATEALQILTRHQEEHS